MIAERIKALRAEMEKRNIVMYIIPTADFHESEYVGEYFKARKYMTGFTGSSGVAVITMHDAGLWTDGRYFIQAERQLEGTPVKLYKLGEEGVPTVREYVVENLEIAGCLGFDGRVVNAETGEFYETIVQERFGSVYAKEDLVGLIWKDRPEFPKNPVFLLDEKYAGESMQSKLARVRKVMEEEEAAVHILTSLYDIAWLFNIRGRDIKCVPVVLSNVIITKTEVFWYINEEVLDEELRAYCEEQEIQIRPYEAIYGYTKKMGPSHKVLLDKNIVNFRIFRSISRLVPVVAQSNPTELMKAMKNETELENLRNAHIKDGVAVTKFLYWLKNKVGTEKITEISASDYLEERRKEQDLFVDLSFETISAYQENAAMMHYSAEEGSNAQLKPEGFLLVDSGGHYLDGSTDVTRTIALGPLSEEEKRHFTAVCRSNLNIAAAKFLYGCRGTNLDILARKPLWDLGLDYRCGTGHGIGFLLNVHEGPNGFRWKIIPEREDCILEEGMVTTDEPGLYIEGKYGIRTENELICKKAQKNEYGQFMEFETVTYVPIDLDAILPEEMTAEDRKLLNDYHKMVYEKISPYLLPEEQEWLKEYTRAI